MAFGVTHRPCWCSAASRPHKPVPRCISPRSVLGATVLSSLSTADAAPLMAAILLGIGVYVLLVFAAPPGELGRADARRQIPDTAAAVPWFHRCLRWRGGGGPVTTSTLLSSGKTAPRTVIGSDSASEFLVALATSLGFLRLREEFLDNLPSVVGLAIGGVLAAPFAA